MKSDEALKLIDAGFTAEEIRAMQNGTPNESDTPTGAEIEADNANVQKGGEVDQTNALAESVKALNDTVKAMQDANLKKASTELNAANTVQKNINDFLKSL